MQYKKVAATEKVEITEKSLSLTLSCHKHRASELVSEAVGGHGSKEKGKGHMC